MKKLACIAALLLAAVPASGTARAEGDGRSAAWTAYCTPCHGSDGRSDTEEGRKRKARNLADSRWLATVSDSRLESSIRRGRDQMPAFGRKLTPEQVKALVAEIRSLPR